ncbi:hypothetical protein K3495_g74 [Podosphaera aphanis]|nr:hypothetical protein K3495_g74 [Podosphaera aphanis]
MSSEKFSKKGAIELLPTNLARLSSRAHPIVLLSAYYQYFPQLVSQPVLTLQHTIVPLTILQIAYVVTCLPVVGRRAVRGTKATASRSSTAWLTTCLPTILISLLLTGLCVPALLALQILFGAPLTTHLPHTSLCATHLALLTLFPLFYVHGVDSAKWREIAAVASPLDEVFGAFVGAFFGGWLGAIPIPLDWDREWQKWPITVLTGIYLGYASGKLIGCGMMGRKIALD